MFAIQRCVRHGILRNQPNLRTLTVCGLIFGLCLSVYAGPLDGTMLSTTVLQANGKAKTVTSQTNYLYNLARKEIRAGNVEKGKVLLQQVLSLNPQHKKAKSELNKLNDSGVSITPKSSSITSLSSMENLSSSELIDAAKAMMRDGDYGGAQTILEAALEKSTDASEKKQIRSFLEAIGKQKERADITRQSTLDYNLSKLERQLQKALIYMNAGQYDKAEIEVQRAKKIAPKDKRVDKLLQQIYKERSETQKTQLASKQQTMSNEQQELKATADVLFQEGVDLYKQGQIIQAVEKWNQALEVYPKHQASQTYLTNTKMEYEQAVAAKQAREEQAAEEAKYEKMLDVEITQYSTQGELIDIKDVLKTLSAFSQLNLVMDENLAGNVALEVKNTTLREILNILQKQYGYKWKREKNTIYVEPGFETRIFPLTEAQYKTISVVLEDPSVLQDPSN